MTMGAASVEDLQIVPFLSFLVAARPVSALAPVRMVMRAETRNILTGNIVDMIFLTQPSTKYMNR